MSTSAAPEPTDSAEQTLHLDVVSGSSGTGGRTVNAPRPRLVAGMAPPARHTKLYVALCRSADLVLAVPILVGVFLISNAHRMPGGLEGFLALRLTVKNLLLLCIFAACWRAICLGAGLYDWKRIRRRREESRRLVLATGVTSAVAMGFPLISVTGAFAFTTPIYFWCVATVTMIAVRRGLRRLTAPDGSGQKAVVIVGSGPRALKAYDELLREDGAAVDVLGFVDAPGGPAEVLTRGTVIAGLDGLEELLARTAIDEVLIALPIKSRYVEIQTALEVCARVGVPAKYLADTFTAGRASPRYDQSEDRPVVSVPAGPDDGRLLVKRGLDLFGASVGLALASPVMAAAAVAIKLTSPGPILFRQERYGQNRRRFGMYKFRTMVERAETLQAALEDHNEAAGPVFKIASDPRVTPIGRFLRRTSIDELPQLWNIIRGEMSLVGPRPLPVRDVHRFAEAALMRRFSVAPGLTGLWQISGRSNLQFDDWIRLDLRYIDDWSLTLDLKILARTVPAVLSGTGAS